MAEYIISSGDSTDGINLWLSDSMTVLESGIANNTSAHDNAWIHVSSGGIVNNTILRFEGWLYVSSGGIVNNTILRFEGWLYVSSGGIANSTLISGGQFHLSSGGIANSTTIKDGGTLYVSSGGTANSTTMNNASMFISGGIANSTTIKDGGTLYVHSGGTANSTTMNNASMFISSGIANSTTVLYGGFLYVSSGGIANNTSVNGGFLYLSSGGTANSTTVNSGGLSIYKGGTANNTTINSGGSMVIFRCAADSTTVNAGGSMVVSSGGTATATVISGGWIYVSSGGTATDIIYTPCEGHVYVDDGAVVSFTSEYSGVYFGSDNQLLSHTISRMRRKELDDLCEMYVMSGGTAISATVNAGGSMFVSGGSADSTTINDSGIMVVSSGGTADSITINSGGSMIVNGGAVNSTTMDHGDIIVSGGTADNTTMNGGSMFVSGGTLNNTTIENNGRVYLSSGGIANNTTLANPGYVYISSGGTANNTVISSGGIEVFSGGTANNTIVSSGGYLNVYEGLADSAVISSGGHFTVRSGGTATDFTISSGATFNFTVAQDTLISGTINGSRVEIKNGMISGFTIHRNSSFSICGGGIANSATISSGGMLTVSYGGTANSTTISSGGWLAISSGGIANETVQKGGTFQIWHNGVVNSATISSGGLLTIYFGGAANSATVSSGGRIAVTADGLANGAIVSSGGLVTVSSGGKADSAVISSCGRITVSSGGTADNTGIGADGKLTVESGGTASRTTVGAGGTLRVESGGELDSVTVQSGGRLTGYYDWRDVTFDPGADLYFDISWIAPENTDALVNLTGLSDANELDLKLTISDAQEAGVYRIAEGAWGFDRTITVDNSVMEFGTLSLDQSVEVNGREYTLSLDDGDLMLSVDAQSVAQYVYLDFDGEDLVRYKNPELGISFNLSVDDPAFSEEQRQAIVSALSERYQKDRIAFTLERPEDVKYSTLYFGLSSEFAERGDFFGVAETHDGNNQRKNDNAFILLDNTYSDGQILSVASHMLDHLMGFSYLADGSQDLKEYAESKTLLSLSAGWNQHDPYNKYCPIDPRTDYRCVTGCTNTAASQIIYYWLEKGMLDLSLELTENDAFQSNKYISIEASDDPVAGHLSFAEVNKLLKNFKLENEDCIAALCFAAGVIQKANYRSSETSTSWNRNLFVRAGLDQDLYWWPGNDDPYIYMYRTWPQISESYQGTDARLADDDFMVRDLLEGRPIAISLRSISHAIVLDGYDSSRNMFHLNYGWGINNSSTRWYTIEELNDLKIDQTVCGISPVISSDLTIRHLTVSDRDVNRNEDITLSFEVFNEGTDASEETRAYIYCGDSLLGNCKLNFISPGYSRDCSLTVNAADLPVGEIALTVEVFSQKDDFSVSSVSRTINHNDDPAPRKPEVSADITRPTNTDVYVSAEFSRIAVTREYSFDKATWSAYAGPVQVIENGTVFFRCADEAGNFSEVVSHTVDNIDKTPPVIELEGDNTTPLRASTLTATTEAGLHISYSTDNSHWSVYKNPIEVTANGTYYFRATDSVGNIGTNSIVFDNIDTTPPVIRLFADNTTPLRAATLTAVVDDDCPVFYRIGDSEEWTEYAGTLEVRENASYTFKATDALGNTGEAGITFANIDRIAPEKPAVSADVTAATNRPVTVTAEFSEDSVIRQYCLDGETWLDYTDPLVFDRNGIVSFLCADAAGNDTYSFFVVSNIDTTRPAKPAAYADVTQATGGPVNVTAIFSEDSEKKEFSLDGGNWDDYTGAVRLEANGTVYFRGTDEAGNVSETTGFEVTNIDTEAPEKPAVSVDVTEPTNEAVLVTAEFSEDSVRKEYSLDGTNWLNCTGAVRITENGFVRFRGIDAAGNESEIAEHEVTNIDRTPPNKPVVSADVTTPTNQSVTVSAEFDEDSVAKEYSFDGKEWMAYTDAILCDRNKTVSFRGIDEAGNASETVSLEVNNIDTDAPGDPAGLQAVVSEHTVALVWNASTDDVSGVKEYVVTYALNGEIFTTATSGTCFVLNKADAGTYSWSVQAVDAAGNESAITAGGAFAVSDLKSYIVEYSTDNFEHVLQLRVDSNTLDSFRLPKGTYQARTRATNSADWTIVEQPVVSLVDTSPTLVKSDENGATDVFFVNAAGTWESCYQAQHVGSVKDWASTNEYVSLSGKNKLTDIFEGSTDANILLMTDDDNGDALFVDDIYSDSPDELGLSQARIARIDEIRAGAGDDIVDMTSQQFEYIGDGLAIRGGDGDDTIWANKGSNRLFGDAGNDRIVGASGNDVIAGGIGNDSMHGRGGDDVFTFCDNWGIDEVEQSAGGSVTLWFASSDLAGSIQSNWNAEKQIFTCTDGTNSVTVSGVASMQQIALKFGIENKEDAAQFAALSGMGAFDAFTSQRIFEESGKGMLA